MTAIQIARASPPPAETAPSPPGCSAGVWQPISVLSTAVVTVSHPDSRSTAAPVQYSANDTPERRRSTVHTACV